MAFACLNGNGGGNDSSPFLFGYRLKLVVLEQSFLPLSRLPLDDGARWKVAREEEAREKEKKLKNDEVWLRVIRWKEGEDSRSFETIRAVRYFSLLDSSPRSRSLIKIYFDFLIVLSRLAVVLIFDSKLRARKKLRDFSLSLSFLKSTRIFVTSLSIIVQLKFHLTAWRRDFRKFTNQFLSYMETLFNTRETRRAWNQG